MSDFCIQKSHDFLSFLFFLLFVVPKTFAVMTY